MGAGPTSATEAQVTAVFYGTGVPTGAVCTLGLAKEADTWGPNDVAALVPAFSHLHQSASSQSVGLGSLELKVGPSDYGPTFTAPVGVPGNIGAGATPPNVCTLIRKEVAGVSARFSGRMFWPGVAETIVDESGKYGAANLTSIQTACDLFMSEISGLGMRPVVFSRKLQTVTSFTVVKFTAQQRTATQRLRLRR